MNVLNAECRCRTATMRWKSGKGRERNPRDCHHFARLVVAALMVEMQKDEALCLRLITSHIVSFIRVRSPTTVWSRGIDPTDFLPPFTCRCSCAVDERVTDDGVSGFGRGGVRGGFGPDPPLPWLSSAAVQLPQTGHSSFAQHFDNAKDRNADKTDLGSFS